MNFHFEEETHTYTLDGVRLRSVSEIIDPLVNLAGIPPDTLAFAAARGKAVHHAAHLLDAGLLVEKSLDQRILGYVNAWRQFTFDYEPQWELSEVPMYDPTLLFAGTPDRYGSVIGTDGNILLDIKNVAKMRAATGVQLTGYAQLIVANDLPEPVELWGLNLHDNGKYTIKEYPFDRRTFNACLSRIRADGIINAWKEHNRD